MPQKTFAIALMDPPYESENLTTAFRILDAAVRRGHKINVFAYEGAAALAFTRQSPHPNPVHGKNIAEENHPTTKDQVAALLAEAAKNGGKVDWVNCGMCVDERGVNEFVPGTRRGSPADFQAFVDASDTTLVIPTSEAGHGQEVIEHRRVCYRAVMEEQDDTILWLLAAMQGAGGAHTVVLRGNAVNYAIAGQGAPGLTVGEWKQSQ